MSICPVCSEEGTTFKGSKSAKYLLVFNKPYEMKSVRDSRLNGLDVLRKELQNIGMDLNADFRQSWLWLHEPSKNDVCYEYGRNLVLDEAKGKHCVICVGSEPCEEFTGMYASDVYGLQVDSAIISAPCFVIPKPEGVFVQGSGIGELRLSIQKLGRILNV